jgi:hypothetical protein
MCSFVEQYFVEGATLQPAAMRAQAQSSSDAGHQGPTTQAPSLESHGSATNVASEGLEQGLHSNSPFGNGNKVQTMGKHSLRQAEPAQASDANPSSVSPSPRSSPFGQHARSAAAVADHAAAGAISGADSSGSLSCEGPATLACIWVYPIKSCAGFAPSSWPLGLNGLLYDRYRQ